MRKLKIFFIAAMAALSLIAGAMAVSGCGGDSGNPSVGINSEGYWVINGEATDVLAEAKNPQIEINADGYWVINGKVTDVLAGIRNGANEDPTAYISFDKLDANGNFYDNVSGKALLSYGDDVQYDTGRFGNALCVSGNSYVSLNCSLPTGNQSHTITAWVKPDMDEIKLNGEYNIVGWGEYRHLSDTRLMIYNKQYCVTSFDVFTTYPIPKDSAENWHHLALVYDSEKYSMYIDGIMIAKVSARDRIDVKKSSLYIGGFGSSGLGFEGLIDEVYVYGKALSGEEIIKCRDGNAAVDMKEPDNKLPENEGVIPVFSAKDSELSEGWNYFNYFYGGADVPFALYIPKNYSADKKLPMLVYLHGDGENGWSNEDVVYGSSAALVKRTLIENPDTVIIVPVANSPWLTVPNDANTGNKYPYKNYSMSDAVPGGQLLAVSALMDECIAELAVDADRIYLTGYSRGTMGVWYLLSTSAERFAGAAVCCGAGDPSTAVNFVNVPLRVFQGDSDPLVSASDVRAVYDAYVAAGGIDGEFISCTDGGHSIENWLYEDDGLIEWLFSGRRIAEHKHELVWETHIPAYCEADGEESAVCPVCGRTFKRTVSALGHKWDGEWVIETQPSCLEEGLEKTECSVCDKPKTRSIPKTAHSFDNGLCTVCGAAMTEGQVKTTVTNGVNAEGGWIVDSENGVYTSKTASDTIIMFDNVQFTRGTIEWDMLVPTNSYMHGTLCGIVFGSANQRVVSSEAGDRYYVFGRHTAEVFTGFSKIDGNFAFEDAAKIEGLDALGKTCHYKLEWNARPGLVTLTFGGNSVSFVPARVLTGKYIGLYAECEGVVFSNITITEDCSKYSYASDGASAWKIENTQNGKKYTTLTNDASLLINDLNFETGTIEWDMTVNSSEYKYGTLCGIIWSHCDDMALNTLNSDFYVSGMYNSGIYVTYAKFDGSNNNQSSLDWENSQQIVDGSIMQIGLKIHYKLIWDGVNLTLEVGGKSVTLQPKHSLTGTGVGLYSEAVGTVFENITVTPFSE